MADVDRLNDLRRFYDLLAALEHKLGGKRWLASCDGRMDWPRCGIYFFLEPGEIRTHSGQGPRLMRVGTHALTSSSPARFGWQGVSHADLYPILRTLRDQWNARYFVIDAIGLGAGLASFLSKIWPPSECLVIPFTFTARSKSDLGWSFLSLVETRRFQDHAPSNSDEGYLMF